MPSKEYNGFVFGPKLYESDEALTNEPTLTSEESHGHEVGWNHLREREESSDRSEEVETTSGEGNSAAEHHMRNMKDEAQMTILLVEKLEKLHYLDEGLNIADKLTAKLRSRRMETVSFLVTNNTVMDTAEAGIKMYLNGAKDTAEELREKCDAELAIRRKQTNGLMKKLGEVNRVVRALDSLGHNVDKINAKFAQHENTAQRILKNLVAGQVIQKEAEALEAHQLRLRRHLENEYEPNFLYPQEYYTGIATQTAASLAELFESIEDVRQFCKMTHHYTQLGEFSEQIMSLTRLIHHEVPPMTVERYIDTQLLSFSTDVSDSEAYETGSEQTEMDTSYEDAVSTLSNEVLSVHDHLNNQCSEELSIRHMEPTESELAVMFPSTTVIPAASTTTCRSDSASSLSFTTAMTSDRSTVEQTSRTSDCPTALSIECPTAKEIEDFPTTVVELNDEDEITAKSSLSDWMNNENCLNNFHDSIALEEVDLEVTAVSSMSASWMNQTDAPELPITTDEVDAEITARSSFSESWVQSEEEVRSTVTAMSIGCPTAVELDCMSILKTAINGEQFDAELLSELSSKAATTRSLEDLLTAISGRSALLLTDRTQALSDESMIEVQE